MKIAITALSVFLLLTLACQQSAVSQDTEAKKWVIGLHGGANHWWSDFNKIRLTPTGTLLVRYGLTRNFSLGLSGGYEELKTYQKPTVTGLDYGYELGTVKLRAIPLSIMGVFHLAPRKTFAPYVYLGAGALFFRRLSGTGTYLPDKRYRTSLMLPAGIGFEAFTSKSVSLVFDAGVRSIGDWIEFRRERSPDGILSAKVGINFYLGGSEAEDDDEDGLTNIEERRYGTDPNEGDTDGDGVKDGPEVNRYRSNPLRIDTDEDGITDGDEILKYNTNPGKIDSDGDQLSDGDEISKHGTDPLLKDTDGDGLRDGEEVLQLKTDPRMADTDRDGLADMDEMQTYKTNPLLSDSDADGLIDGDEVRRTMTDPLKADTDRGGENDGAEALHETNPLDPRDDLPNQAIKLERGSSVILEGVSFQSGSAWLARASEPVLQKVFEALRANPDLRVEISGHTDNQGKPEANDRLSLRRAEAVKTWLVKKGISALRLTTVGSGSRKPIAPNTTAEGRAKNRRIEFSVK
jgi:outer membrane protein OmpA-like peptidoglycan-associated protein